MIKDEKLQAAALIIQRNEISEYHVYTRLAKLCRNAHNAEVLRSIGEAEKRHADFWRERTGVEVNPSLSRVFINVFLARFLGLTFSLKRMEKKEGIASKNYGELAADFPEVKVISEDEAKHERALLDMLDEGLLRYVGSIVLGLNDALVELTGALAGFTLALGSAALISLAGLVTGISAAFSMTASAYLSSKAENNPQAAKSAIYTGITYLITMFLLILPFLFAPNKFIALGITLFIAILIIFVFNYYLSMAKDLNFKRRFAGMALISLGVAVLSFGIGWILRQARGVDA
jgi:VIT1/CCC1 family predicted Fe2+/Mn2+ transporter